MTVLDVIDRLPRSLVPRALSLVGPTEMCNTWRAYWPSSYLAARGFVADWCSYEQFNAHVPLILSGRYNVIVTPRVIFESEAAYAGWHQGITGAGLAWVCDLDDDLLSPEYTDRQMKVLQDIGAPAVRATCDAERSQRVFLAQQADLVTVASDNLGLVAHQARAKRVEVVPNAINPAILQVCIDRSTRIVPPLTIGWSGTARDDDDLQAVGAAWATIAQRFPDVKFVVQGFASPSLCASVPRDRITLLPPSAPEDYAAVLMNFDIACCSVADVAWNTRKTGVKWMEATVAGAACVVSRTLYSQYVTHMVSGLMAETAEEWVYALCSLIVSENLRRDLNANARKVIAERYSMEVNWPNWVMAWSGAVAAVRGATEQLADVRSAVA